MRPEAQLPAGIPQGQGHVKIRDTGVLNGGIFQRGVLIADGAAGYHNVAGADIQINAAAGADADEGIRADIGQLLHGDGRGRAADAGGADRNLHADMDRVFKMSSNGLAPSRVSGQEYIAAHIALGAVNMILLFCFLHSRFSFVELVQKV